MIAPIMIACSGSTDPDDGGCEDCGTGEIQIASTTVNPKSATIARGGSTSVTANYTASPNLTISGFHIQRQPTGIAVTQTSTSVSGNNGTRSYTISADNTVPIGTHVVSMWISVNNATSTVTTTRAEFSLTVTQ